MLTNKKTLSYLKASLLLQVSLLFLWGCSSSSDYQKFEGPTQGTSYHITAQLPKGVERKAVEAEITKTLDDIDVSLSTYRDDSEISRFNALPVNKALAVSPVFIDVLNISREVYEQSGHVFDPAVKPLIDIWGFGSNPSLEAMQKIPDAKTIAKAKAELHFDGVVNDGLKLKKLSPVTLDFNGVAQGYAVDALKNAMLRMGIHNFMIEVGGEVATDGVSPRNTPWRIGIETPVLDAAAGASIFKALDLDEANVSTSGDYRDYYEVNGKRYSHTIDPRTGKPIDHKLTSVTVVTKSVAHADAWCTAFMVLGEDEGYKLAEKLGMAAYFIYREGSGFAVKSTSAMQKYLEHEG